eukprot:2103713-Prymnesium_polylepis.2
MSVPRPIGAHAPPPLPAPCRQYVAVSRWPPAAPPTPAPAELAPQRAAALRAAASAATPACGWVQAGEPFEAAVEAPCA